MVRATSSQQPIGKRINSLDQSVLREFLNIESAQASTAVFRTKVIVDGHRTIALIDSGADGNFASESFVKSQGIATRSRREGTYKLTVADGSPLPKVERETIPLLLAIQQHYEEIVLDVIDMASHDIVLGMPWLRKHNLVID